MEKRRDVFQAIADPTRREILCLIAKEPLNLNSIAENFDMSRPAISQHIKVLDDSGLVVMRKKEGKGFATFVLKKLRKQTIGLSSADSFGKIVSISLTRY